MTAAAPAASWTPFDTWAEQLGTYAWFDQRLFELLGAWAPLAPEPEACLVLARHARRRAWHAELWDRLLPTVAGREGWELVQPPSSAVADFVAGLAPDPSSPTATIDLLVAVNRVVGPAQAQAQAAHRAAASPLAEGPTIRTLDLVISDVTADLGEGADLAVALAGSDQVAATEAGVETKWREAAPSGW